MYSFPYLEPVCCSMSSSNCCFLTCTQISQEAGKVVWYSHLFKNSPHCCGSHSQSSLLSSSVHGLLQARILEWVAFPSSGDLPNPGIEPASLMSLALAGRILDSTWVQPCPVYLWFPYISQFLKSFSCFTGGCWIQHILLHSWCCRGKN